MPNPQRDPTVRITYEQFLAWLRMFPSEASRIQRAIELQRSGGFTDPAERNRRSQLSYEAFIAYLQRNPGEARKQQERINNQRAGGHTDPTDEDGYNTGNGSAPSQNEQNSIHIKAGGDVTDPVQGAVQRFGGQTRNGKTPRGIKPGTIKGGGGH